MDDYVSMTAKDVTLSIKQFDDLHKKIKQLEEADNLNDELLQRKIQIITQLEAELADHQRQIEEALKVSEKWIESTTVENVIKLKAEIKQLEARNETLEAIIARQKALEE